MARGRMRRGGAYIPLLENKLSVIQCVWNFVPLFRCGDPMIRCTPCIFNVIIYSKNNHTTK